MPNDGSFKFRRHDTVGNPSAESDEEFLTSCFVDNGELNILRDMSDQRNIVLGRTGAGKTALLLTIEGSEDRAIWLDPLNLALGYISNSTVLSFFEELGVKMDLFYRFLWRHVLIVEVVKRHFGTSGREDKSRHIEQMRNLFRKQSHRDAIDYLDLWGTSFWATTEDRIKEITEKVETDLSTRAQIGMPAGITLGAGAASKLTQEQRREISHRGQEVINSTQMSKLSLLFDALST